MKQFASIRQLLWGEVLDLRHGVFLGVRGVVASVGLEPTSAGLEPVARPLSYEADAVIIARVGGEVHLIYDQ